jgi:hypothetical protein
MWTQPDPLNNIAKTRSIYITELQEAINVKRAEISLPPISFIDQSVGKKFRLDAIEELKTVTNDLAILYGYPAGVEDSSLLGRPYVAIIKKYGKYVCHYPIINDLRLVLNLLQLRVGLIFANILDSVMYPKDQYVTTFDITDGLLIIKDRFMKGYTTYTRISSDNSYLFRLVDYPTGYDYVYKDNPIDGTNIVFATISDFVSGKDITVDENYCWLLGTKYSISNEAIAMVNKSTLGGLIIYSLANMIDFRTFYGIINDKNYIYILGTKNNTSVHPTINYVNETIIRRYNKSNMSIYTEYVINANLVPPSPRTGNDPNVKGWDITIDENYLYITYSENINMLLEPRVGPPFVRTKSSCIVQIDKNTMAIATTFDVDVASTERFANAGIVASRDYLYVVARQTGTLLEYAIYDKFGTIKAQSSTIDASTIGREGQNLLACSEEYQIVQI